MIDTNGKQVTHCPQCGESYDVHKWESVRLEPDFKTFSTTGGTFILPKCPPKLKLVK